MSVRIDQNAGSGAEAAAPTPGRWGAISTGICPVLLLAAFLWHPPIPGRLPDDAAVAEAAAADLTRWGSLISWLCSPRRRSRWPSCRP